MRWTRGRGIVPAAGLAAAAVAGCAGQGGELSAAVAAYCNASTPQLRAILRVPLIRLMDLPADTGELFCLGDSVVVAPGAGPAGAPAEGVTVGD